MSVEGGTTLKVTDESLAQAARVIRDGGLVVIPTDTVYGVACDPRNKAAIDRIYRLKRRPRYKALQVLLASTDQLDELGLDLPSPLNRLSAAFLPGAFSPIAVVDLYLDGGPTQGHVSSTVVKADPYARDGIEILREGVIAQNVIRKALHLNGGGLGA